MLLPEPTPNTWWFSDQVPEPARETVGSSRWTRPAWVCLRRIGERIARAMDLPWTPDPEPRDGPAAVTP